MAKRKAGLHKGLSEILNGVTIPRENVNIPSSSPPSGIPTAKPGTYSPPKPLTKDPQLSSNRAGLPQSEVRPQPSIGSSQSGGEASPPTAGQARIDAKQATAPAQKSSPPSWALPKIIPPQAVDKLRQQQAKSTGITSIFKQIPWQIFHARASRS